MNPCGKLSLSQQKDFVKLVDSNAKPKAYLKLLGLSLDEVRLELRYLATYRKNVELADKIAEIRKSSISKTKQDKQIEKLRKENEV